MDIDQEETIYDEFCKFIFVLMWSPLFDDIFFELGEMFI